jgi:hypothetical protein
VKSSWLIGPACLAIGLGVGAFMAGDAPVASTSSVIEQNTTITTAAARQLRGDEVAAIVRQEVTRALAAREPAAAPPATLEEAHERMSDEQVERAERASQVIGAAVARGRWGEAERSALVGSLESLPAPVQAEITGQLAVAINSGKLQVDVDLPL